MSVKSILFVCLGNICRSPMAEGVFNRLLKEKGLQDKFEVDSAGLHGYHAGELPDSRMRAHASKRGYNLTHRCRPVFQTDFDQFDMLIGMDEQNIRGLKNLAPTAEHRVKIYRMTDFLTKIEADEVPDPYYGGPAGFEYVIDLLEDACSGLLDTLITNH
ncbi:MAG: low molecular weight protein-tyrosine-phosphatase [Paludibacter sp.]|jgi:protein-tyrosine phosphatase|nr:low molecular weight protein-tyrosine-phosphatase [Paludibacter sp.]HOS45717.1 low molecular weight protein-tyrosine-phosphatase [Paludibacter sp.]HPM08835.1 low molecular weight protein-tyrosine-phosphatase [Paludibacter sp.]